MVYAPSSPRPLPFVSLPFPSFATASGQWLGSELWLSGRGRRAGPHRQPSPPPPVPREQMNSPTWSSTNRCARSDLHHVSPRARAARLAATTSSSSPFATIRATRSPTPDADAEHVMLLPEPADTRAQVELREGTERARTNRHPAPHPVARRDDRLGLPHQPTQHPRPPRRGRESIEASPMEKHTGGTNAVVRAR